MELKKLTMAEFRGTHGIYAGEQFLVNLNHIVRVYPDKTGQGYDNNGTKFLVIELVTGKTVSVMDSMENWSYT